MGASSPKIAADNEKFDDLTVDTDFTPPTTAYDGEGHSKPPTKYTSSIVEVGKTYIITEAETGRALTMINGQPRLQPVGTPGVSIHWRVHDYQGWLGFRNVASGGYLGHNKKGTLHTMPHHADWESFCLRMVPSGGFVMVMKHWDRLWPVKAKEEDGEQKLAKMDAPVHHGLVWIFSEVSDIMPW